MKIAQKVLLVSVITLLVGSSCDNGSPEPRTTNNDRFNVEKTSFPEKEFLITDFGAVNDGVTLNTEFINRTIDECSNAGGGKVIIPAGVWVTGPIQLRSNVNLHLADGALVMFSRNFDDYPFVYTYFEGQRDLRAMPLIYGDSLENIAITGKGIFDGSGEIWRPVKRDKMTGSQWSELIHSGGVLSEDGSIWWPTEYTLEAAKNPGQVKQQYAGTPEMDRYKPYFRPPLVQLVSCNKVLLDGPLFENSPGWCIHPLMCTNLTIDDITVRNPWFAQNGDGIDVESCKFVTITNSTFDVGDDAICLKSGKDKEGRDRGMPTQYVDVDNCIVHHGHGGFVVGSEMSGGVKDIWVRNCSFTGTDVGLRFKSTRGRGGVVENIHIENIRMINIERDAIIFNLFYAGLAPTEMGEDPIESLIKHAPEASEATPEFRNIFISDVYCQGAERAIQLLGLPEMSVSNLSVKNSVFTTRRGISCLFASGFTLENVIVNSDEAPAMSLINVKDAEIGSFRSNQEVLLHIDGQQAGKVLVKDEDVESLRKRIVIGEKAGEDVLEITSL